MMTLLGCGCGDRELTADVPPREKSCNEQARSEQPAPMPAQPEFRRNRTRLRVEASVRSVVGFLVHGVPEIVRPSRILGLVGLLRVVAVMGEIAIDGAGHRLFTPDRLQGRPAEAHLTRRM